MRAARLAGFLAALMLLGLASPAAGRHSPSVAALQVALRSRGDYAGSIDGVSGTATVTALRRFQRRAGLPPSGLVDRRTRKRLGVLGRPLAGERTIGVGSSGWDVSVLEFELARHGFAPGRIDGRFDLATLAAVERFRRFSGLPYHCLVEPSTLNTLRQAKLLRPHISLDWPIRGRIIGKFGVRGNHLHAGIDIAAPYGSGVAPAAGGRVVYADEGPAGLGLMVRIAHARGVDTIYGHLARIDVKVGQRVVRGGWLGLVGRTGNTLTPKLYLEVRVRGAAVDPLTALR
jgi:murein DD-endopeptidase MepM/ murein hydrolase activator NlpD